MGRATTSRSSARRRGRAVRAGLLAGLLGGLLAGAGLGPAAPATAATGAPAASAGTSTGTVYVIQGIVGRKLDVVVDGEQALAAAAPKSIVGPLDLKAGTHTVEMRSGSEVVARADVQVRAGTSTDVVGHLQADAGQKPEITAFSNDVRAVGRGKLRLAIAHVAAAPPADIRVDDKVLFSNVANGEALKIVVPGGTYNVAVVPAATGGDAILGPVDLAVRAGTLTRVFAVGDVTRGSMDAVVHSIPVRQTGAAVPGSVQTGDGGQAATAFTDPVAGTGRDVGSALLVGLALGVVGLALSAFAGPALTDRVPRLWAALPRRPRT